MSICSVVEVFRQLSYFANTSTRQLHGTDFEACHENHNRNMSEAKRTQDHDKIRKWVEERGGKPAQVKGTGSTNSVGLLRIDFPGYSGEDSLEEITWEEFFDKFDRSGLYFLYQEKTTDGNTSRFSKFVAEGED
jgi:hypothetical protein